MKEGILVRPLNIAELGRINEIDVSESGTAVYKQVGRELELVDEEWHRPPRSEEAWASYSEQWKPVLEGGGSVVGCFAGHTLIGIAVLRLRLTESMAQLVALFVSKEYRRLRVAAHLTEEVARLARLSGAKALYVSATPSVSAVGFYLSQGFEPAEHVNEALYALEPEDVHMVKPL